MPGCLFDEGFAPIAAIYERGKFIALQRGERLYPAWDWKQAPHQTARPSSAPLAKRGVPHERTQGQPQTLQNCHSLAR